MINVADLPSVHAQAARAKAEGASPPSTVEPTQSPSQSTPSEVSSKPTLAFDEGRYYVVDRKK
ncbi:hypothetical protein [Massilia sp. Root1485]|uniref:hypothetical protein n=1 Tax=Massilia sp. Root1485 TaxID=1736472 RepID=UPI000B27CDAC|nr:hypothetical protein [Massilia sp. Root1485]